jgi:hypothetical protein
MIFMSVLLACGIYAQDDNATQTEWGKVEGLIRLYHVFSPAYVKSGREPDYDIDGSTIGGHLRYHTPELSGVGATTAVYYARGTGLNDKDDPNTIMAAGRFFTSDYSARAVWGELNLHYEDDTHHGVIGRFKVDSPLTNSIYTFMPNMFQAALYENSAIASTTITVAHIEKMAYGSRAPVEFGLIGEKTYTAGATQPALETRGDFLDIEKQTLNDPTAKTNGITAFAAENSSLQDTKLRAWDFYAYDIMNMFYLDAVYSNKDVSFPLTLSAQYLRTDSVGKDLASKWMDSSSAYMYGAMATLTYGKAFFSLAYNHSGDSRIVNPWNGDPAYTSTFFSRNAYRANVDAYKAGFNYDLLDNLTLINYHADYGKSSTQGTFAPIQPAEPLAFAQADARESGCLLLYKPVKGLTVFGGVIYKTSEYYVSGKQVELLDVDLVVTYRF